MDIKKLCIVAGGFSEFDKRIVSLFHSEVRKIIDTSLIILEFKDGALYIKPEQINEISTSDAIVISGSAILTGMMEIIEKLKKTAFVIVDDFLAENGIRAINFIRINSFEKTRLSEYLSETINHDLVNYFFFDGGQAFYLSKLNILKKKIWHIPFSCWFGIENTENYDDQDIDISFIGNISPVYFSPKYQNLFLKCFFDKLNDLQRPAFEIFLDNVSTTEQNISSENPIFWMLYRHISWFFINPMIRTYIIGNIKKKVVYPGFDLSIIHQGLGRPLIHQISESNILSPNQIIENVFLLPEKIGHVSIPKLENVIRIDFIPYEMQGKFYRRSKINLLITNAGVQTGISPHVLTRLSAGAFFLTDPRYELKEIFGECIELVTYRNIDELNDKIDYYLSHPSERRDIVMYLREKFLEFTKGMTPAEILVKMIRNFSVP